MITFKEFLIEDDNPTMYDNNEIIEIAGKLDESCQIFLKAIHHQITRYAIYRGVRSIPPSKAHFQQEKVRKDRKSLDSGKEVHNFMDDWMNENLGGRFRSQALFGINDFKTGLVYGESVGAVFPIGNFKFAWSSKYNDVYEALRIRNMEKSVKDPEKMNEFMKDAEYSNKNLQGAISSNNEIMIMGDNYYFLNLGDNPTKAKEILRLVGSKLK